VAARRSPSSGALRKVLLCRQAGLSFARGLYTEGDGGVEGVCDVDDDADANVAAASLEAAEKKGPGRSVGVIR
jgi:hypothetical protein